MADMSTAEWTGRQVVDTAGQKIGTISDVRYNEMLDPTGDPEWLIVKAGVFGTKRIYIPARDVRMDGDRLRVPYTEDRVKDSPAVAKDQPLTRDEERELYIYYGLELTEPTVTAAPSAMRGAGVGTDADIGRGPEVTPPTERPQRDREPVGTGRRQR